MIKINELPELTDPSGSHIVGYKGNDTVQIPTDAVVSKAQAQEIISDAYSATKAYKIGEYCIYNNSLYKCIANTSAGITPTNSTYWTNTRVSEELASNARAIASLSYKNFGFKSYHIMSYTSKENQFTAPTSGYVQFTAPSSVRFTINGDTICQGNGQIQGIYVPKGAPIYFAGGTPDRAYFSPINYKEN